MLVLIGMLVNVFETPKGTDQDGNEYGGKWRAQVMAKNLLKNGQERAELLDVGIDSPAAWRERVGQEIRIQVGLSARGGRIFYFSTGVAQKSVSQE